MRYVSDCGALREVLHGDVLMPQGFALFVEFADDHVDILFGTLVSAVLECGKNIFCIVSFSRTQLTMSSWSSVDIQTFSFEIPKSSVYSSTVYTNLHPSSERESAWYSTVPSSEGRRSLNFPVLASKNRVS